jgi:hypothetical protein
VAVVQDGVVRAVRFLDLVQALRDEEALDAVSGEVRELPLEKREAPERRELIEEHEQLVPVRGPLEFEALGEAPSNLIQHQANERPRAIDV